MTLAASFQTLTTTTTDDAAAVYATRVLLGSAAVEVRNSFFGDVFTYSDGSELYLSRTGYAGVLS